jgi:hypothetical protein
MQNSVPQNNEMQLNEVRAGSTPRPSQLISVFGGLVEVREDA